MRAVAAAMAGGDEQVLALCDGKPSDLPDEDA
jgi:hypothetical protein